MHDEVARVLYHVQIHLFYASVVGLAAVALTATRAGSASAKYWICVVASLNFVVPVSALLDASLASHLGWASPLELAGGVADRLARRTTGIALASVWAGGSALMLARLAWRLRVEVREARAAAPAVIGLFRPRISLPDGLDRLLSPRELDAVLLHERTHARRRDNLIRLLHELTLCLLWFHPLVWLAGARLALFRELSCDDSAIRGARGKELVSALGKLARSDDAVLLQAGASSLIRHRLARLAEEPRPAGRAPSVLVAAAFAAALAWGILSTISHTACCFLGH